MPINQLKFIKNMIERYRKRTALNKTNLNDDIIADIVVTVLKDAPEMYFTYDMVQEHPEFCKKCGACCRQRHEDCPYFNGRTCDEYPTRHNNCAEFPYYEIDTDDLGRGLWLDPGCNFAVKLAEMVLDEEIKKQEDSFNDLLG